MQYLCVLFLSHVHSSGLRGLKCAKAGGETSVEALCTTIEEDTASRTRSCLHLQQVIQEPEQKRFHILIASLGVLDSKCKFSYAGFNLASKTRSRFVSPLN